MLQINQAVVDRGCGQQEQLLFLGQIEEHPVTGRSSFTLALDADVSEVVSLIDDHHIGLALQHRQLLRPIVSALQIGVIDDD